MNETKGEPKTNPMGKCPLWQAPCPERYCAWWGQDAQECLMVALAARLLGTTPGGESEGEIALREAES